MARYLENGSDLRRFRDDGDFWTICAIPQSSKWNGSANPILRRGRGLYFDARFSLFLWVQPLVLRPETLITSSSITIVRSIASR